MAVWLARTQDAAKPAPLPTIASKAAVSASHCHHGDTLTAMNDQQEPASSNDHGIPRMTWWDHKGTREWVQYDFPEPTEVSAVKVYWFDDTGMGQCRVPKSWTVRYRAGDRWHTVDNLGQPDTERDTYNRVAFSPVATEALRLDVKLQEGASGGILEWVVE